MSFAGGFVLGFLGLSVWLRLAVNLAEAGCFSAGSTLRLNG
ncbi:MAG: hypothetical protein QXK47_05475 [Candidatus Bathyarchaeia archaeon]